MSDARQLKIRFEYPIFEDYIMPDGFLPRDRAAHACFYYFMLCEEAKERVGKSIDDQVVYEGHEWLSTHFKNQRHAIMMMYQLESMEVIDKYWPAVKLQARAMGLPEPDAAYMENRSNS